MKNKIIPKKENENKGFSYTVSDEQIAAYSKWTIAEKLRWLEETNKLIYSLQTPEERKRMLQLRNGEW